MKELQPDTSIVILPADKGRYIVSLTREDYLEKCMDHINNGPYEEGPASSTTAEIYMQTYECTTITTSLHPPKVWEQFFDDVYSILKCTPLENFFHHINNLHQNINYNGGRK